MSYYDYSPSSSPTYIREQATLWHDDYDSTIGWTKKFIYHDESLSLPIINDNPKFYIEKLKEKIAEQQTSIYEKERKIKELNDTHSKLISILTSLWNKSLNIDLIKTREEIKEILKIWYEKNS